MKNEEGFIALLAGAPWEVWAMVVLGIGVVVLTAYLEGYLNRVSDSNSESQQDETGATADEAKMKG